MSDHYVIYTCGYTKHKGHAVSALVIDDLVRGTRKAFQAVTKSSSLVAELEHLNHVLRVLLVNDARAVKIAIVAHHKNRNLHVLVSKLIRAAKAAIKSHPNDRERVMRAYCRLPNGTMPVTFNQQMALLQTLVQIYDTIQADMEVVVANFTSEEHLREGLETAMRVAKDALEEHKVGLPHVSLLDLLTNTD